MSFKALFVAFALAMPVVSTSWLLPDGAIAADKGTDEAATILDAHGRKSVDLFNEGLFSEAAMLTRDVILPMSLRVHGKTHRQTVIYMANLAAMLERQGLWQEAATLHGEILDIRQGTLGVEAPETLETHLSYGKALYNAAKPERAREVLEDYLGTRKAAGHVDDDPIYGALDHLVALADQQQDPGTAIPHLRRMLVILESLSGVNPAITAGVANKLGIYLERTGAIQEAVGPMRKAFEFQRQSTSDTHPNTISIQVSLASILRQNERLEDARRLLRDAISNSDPGDADFIASRMFAFRQLGLMARDTGDFSEASSHFRAEITAQEILSGAQSNETSLALNRLGLALESDGQLQEAEKAFRRSLSIDINNLGDDHISTAQAKSNLADVLAALGQNAEAEVLYRQAVASTQAGLGPDHERVSTLLNNLGLLLYNTGQYADALGLLQRATAISENIYGPESPSTMTAQNNVGLAFMELDRHGEAIDLFRAMLPISRRVRGTDHPDTSIVMNNLALALEADGAYDEAQVIFKDALEIDERTSGRVHPNTAIALSNYARALRRSGGLLQQALALTNYERSVDIYEQLYGPDHIDVADARIEVAGLAASVGDTGRAGIEFDLAIEALTRPINRPSLSGRRTDFISAVAAKSGTATAEQTFELVQWPMRGAASGAIDAMAVRASAVQPQLQALLRSQQDAREEIGKLDQGLLTAFATGDQSTTEALKRRQLAVANALADRDRIITREFPQFEALTGAEPVTAAAAAGLLHDGEALALISPGLWDIDHPVPGSIHIVLPDGSVRSAALEGGDGLQRDFSRLRCSFVRQDRCSASDKSSGSRLETNGQDLTRGAMRPESSAPKRGFDAALAHDLYKRIFGHVTPALSGVDHLIIVTDHDALSNVPMQVLLSAPVEDEAALQNAHWLIRHHALTVLPNVQALRAIRLFGAAKDAPRPTKAFLGVGDPVIGRSGPMRCEDEPLLVALAQEPRLREVGSSVASLIRDSEQFGGIEIAVAEASAVRQLPRLPDTRCELMRVAESVGGGDLLLDEDANETLIKALNANGGLRDYRILSFATHGLVAGEAGAAEPALVLTPPEIGTVDDDGLLTASEVATLNLNADWVILSACNTAAGTSSEEAAQGTESLSGLARAFFYAGARSLLVSYWPVASPAAVRLTTGAFDALEKDPSIGRAEAMRRSMLAILDDPNATASDLDPFYWAPFSLVGEGNEKQRI